MSTPSDAVILATIASFTAVVASVCTLLGQIAQKKETRENRKLDAAERKEIADKVAQHSVDLNNKLDANSIELEKNTNITVEAYREANNYAGKLERLDSMEAEMKRLSENIHRIASLLAPLVAGGVELIQRDPATRPSNSRAKS